MSKFKAGDRVQTATHMAGNIKTGTIIGEYCPDLWLVRFDGESGSPIYHARNLVLVPVIPSLSARHSAVVDAAKAFRADRLAAGDMPQTEAGKRLLREVDALIAAEAPCDPWEELREASAALYRAAGNMQRTVRGTTYSVPEQYFTRLDAALAALPKAAS